MAWPRRGDCGPLDLAVISLRSISSCSWLSYPERQRAPSRPKGSVRDWLQGRRRRLPVTCCHEHFLLGSEGSPFFQFFFQSWKIQAIPKWSPPGTKHTYYVLAKNEEKKVSYSQWPQGTAMTVILLQQWLDIDNWGIYHPLLVCILCGTLFYLTDPII
jgi:hypothetical protein